MRCTKCHYLSFEPEPRCKNCGHDLSLEDASAFNLADGESESFATAGSHGYATAVMAPPKVATSAHSSRIPTKDLPLFVQSMQSVSDQLAHGEEEEHHEDLEPLVKVPARPRTPMSVRRPTPDPARLRAKYGMSSSTEPDLWSNMPADPIDQVALHNDSDTFQDLPLTRESMDHWTEGPVDQSASVATEQWTEGPSDQWTHDEQTSPDRAPIGWQQPVSVGARIGAALIDTVLLGGISAIVIYLTLQVTGLTLSQIGLLPVLPLGGLLAMLVGGYFLMFKMASGQTLGTMAMSRAEHAGR
jgi:hypothetical protein